jgi:cytochrome b6-f complex iron-sulfur subunit
MLALSSSTVLVIAIPVLFALAVLVVVGTTLSRRRSTTAHLTREARQRDASGDATPAADETDIDDDARERFAETRRELALREGGAPAMTPIGGLARAGALTVDPEVLGVTRRQFFNRGIVSAQGLVLGSFGAAILAFLWPGQSGGFGGKVLAGKLADINAFFADKKAPFYVPEARTYLNPFPKDALAKARKAYKGQTKSMGMEDGIVALYQKCVHLGCRVPWCQTSQWFECPCHGSKYNRVGEKVGGPAPRGLDRWAVEIASGTVTINTGIAYQGPPIGTNSTGQGAEGPHCIAL